MTSPRAPRLVKSFVSTDDKELEGLLDVFDESYNDTDTVLFAISGQQQQWNAEKFFKERGRKKTLCSIKEKAIQHLKSEFGISSGTHFRNSDWLGMRTTELAQRQCPHADMNHPFAFVFILYLSACESAYFHPEMFEETKDNLLPYPLTEEVIDDDSGISNWSRYYRFNFSAMISVDTSKYKSFCVNAGDMVIFRGDSIHFGPGADSAVDRKMFFFTAKIDDDQTNSRLPESYDSDSQLQPWIVAERIYGTDSEIWRGVMRQMQTYNPHSHYNLQPKEVYADDAYLQELNSQLEDCKTHNRHLL